MVFFLKQDWLKIVLMALILCLLELSLKANSLEKIPENSAPLNTPTTLPAVKIAPNNRALPSQTIRGSTLHIRPQGQRRYTIHIKQISSQLVEASKINEAELLNIRRSIEKLLSLTGWFDFTSQKTHKEDYVVEGYFENSSPSALILKLYDSSGENMLLGKSYQISKMDTLHLITKRFCDLILENITGARGPFLSKITFVGSRERRAFPQLYTSYIDGSDLKQHTFNSSIQLSPSWSPDGKNIVFTSFISGRPEIYVLRTETNKIQKLTNRPGNSSGAAWSPEGRIAFAGSDGTGNTHLYSVSSYGGKEEILVNQSRIEVEPSFSPGLGEKLAYTSSKFLKPMIFIRDLKTNIDTQLTTSGWYNASARWHPNGKELVFASYDRPRDRWDVFKVKEDGSQLGRLTIHAGDNLNPSYSPDGRFILFHSTRGLEQGDKAHPTDNPPKLYIMTEDGLSQTPLSIPLAESRLASWGPFSDTGN